MDLAEDLPPISALPVTSKPRSWPRAALAFRPARQWVITSPDSQSLLGESLLSWIETSRLTSGRKLPHPWVQALTA